MMAAAAPPLPPATSLNIAALAGLFRHTTNSYKFVFFLALLEILRRDHFQASRPYSYTEITVEMLTIAGFAHTFKLSFGTQDTLAQKLDALDLNLPPSPPLFAGDCQVLRTALQNRDLKDAQRLMDFVPYRLLMPFLEPQLQGVDKGAWLVFEKALPKIANTHFATARPLYRFNSDDYRECERTTVHPDWAAYLARHEARIHDWAAWHWLQYMQRRNPATPVRADHLFPPAPRAI